MKNILVLHGPNLNLLGMRDPEVYGENSLEWINTKLYEEAKNLGLSIKAVQSNHEGVLIDLLQAAQNKYDGIVFNPGGYTHTSVAIRDAIAAIQVPVVEVHLSNISSREPFRQVSLIGPVCIGSISGFGWISYSLALKALSQID